MEMAIRPYRDSDLDAMKDIWNEVVLEGNAFPQINPLATRQEAELFFASQSFTGVAEVVEKGNLSGQGEHSALLGLYILHPNNVGRCGHLANASYAVRSSARGQHIGEALVRHCMEKGRELGFRVLQFNAVVKSNRGAIRLYEKLGFVRLGEVPEGFLCKDGSYEDILLFYHTL